VQVPLRKEYPNKFFLPLAALERALFLGQDPERIKDDLKNLKDYPGLLCAPTWSCDSYYYLWGLAAELAGDEQKAVAAYHRLWQDYSRSPFTTLARLKLEGSGVVQTAAPTASATPTLGTPAATVTLGTPLAATGTPTPTLSPTPTVTGTPPTATPSATPTVTGTPPTATPTITGTPPTATPSPTQATTYPGETQPATNTPYTAP
jgi:hypothetical protein